MAISLSTIKRSTMLPPRIVIYGVPGIGKTEFASLAPKPIFLNAEDGMGQIEADGWSIKSYQDAIDAITVLYNEPHDYQTVVLDTADALEPMLWAYVCATVPHEKGKPITGIEDYGFGKGYVHAIQPWLQVLSGLTALRDHRNMVAIICAHCKVQNVKAPDSDDYEKYALKIHDKAEGLVRGWCDALMFANYETSVVSNGRDDKRNRAVGVGKRLLYTQERPAFNAKNRYSLPPILPFEKGQSWNTFVAAQAASYAASRAAAAPAPEPELASTSATPAQVQ